MATAASAMLALLSHDGDVRVVEQHGEPREHLGPQPRVAGRQAVERLLEQCDARRVVAAVLLPEAAGVAERGAREVRRAGLSPSRARASAARAKLPRAASHRPASGFGACPAPSRAVRAPAWSTGSSLSAQRHRPLQQPHRLVVGESVRGLLGRADGVVHGAVDLLRPGFGEVAREIVEPGSSRSRWRCSIASPIRRCSSARRVADSSASIVERSSACANE